MPPFRSSWAIFWAIPAKFFSERLAVFPDTVKFRTIKVSIVECTAKISLSEYPLIPIAIIIGKSPSTMSRLENTPDYNFPPTLLKEITDALGVTVSYLLKDQYEQYTNHEGLKIIKPGEIMEFIVEDDEMEPEIPEGAVVRLRGLLPKEKLQEGRFYYIAFNNKKRFRMAVDDEDNGLGFLPAGVSELRISYDRDYVTIIGKVVSMEIIHEDEINFE